MYFTVPSNLGSLSSSNLSDLNSMPPANETCPDLKEKIELLIILKSILLSSLSPFL